MESKCSLFCAPEPSIGPSILTPYMLEFHLYIISLLLSLQLTRLRFSISLVRCLAQHFVTCWPFTAQSCLLLSQLLCSRYALCSMSWTACSLFSQPSSISGCVLSTRNTRTPFPTQVMEDHLPEVVQVAYSVFSCLHSIRGGRLRREKHKSLAVCCFIATCLTLGGHCCGRPLPWLLVFTEVSDIDWRWGVGGLFVHLAHDATGKPNAVFSSQKPCFSIKSRNPDSEFLPAFV